MRPNHFFTIFLLFSPLLMAQTAMQNPSAREGFNLDGVWDIIVDPLENGFYDYRYREKDNGFFIDQKKEGPSDLVEYDFSSSDQLNVPGDWNTQLEKLYYYEGTIWYKKTFTLSELSDNRWFIHFGAVNYEAIVYINGKKAGTHEGGFTPFQFEITDLVKPGENLVVVKADNSRKRENVPTVNTDWWNYGGITRSVAIVKTPPSFIEDYHIQLDDQKQEFISGNIKVNNPSPNSSFRISIPELGIDENYIPKDGRVNFRIRSNPELWSPTTPKRYKIELTYGSDTITDKIGFRTIAVAKDKILLNGEETFLKGICLHEETPFGAGRATSADEARVLLGWAKELGCNFVRLAHYPHNEHMVRVAEEMGIMVWSEIPVYWTVLFDNNQVYQKAAGQLKEMIERDKNRCSVIMWSVANETPVSEERNNFLKNLIVEAKNLDPNRLITAAMDSHSKSQGSWVISDPLTDYVDVIGINSYCGWYGGTPGSCKDWKWENPSGKPVVISEFGAGALQGYHGNKDEIWTEEYQDDVYRNNLEMIKNMPFVAGMSPWILKDFKSPRRNLKRIQNDFNRKGLISDQGIKKKAFYTMKSFYSKM